MDKKPKDEEQLAKDPKSLVGTEYHICSTRQDADNVKNHTIFAGRKIKCSRYANGERTHVNYWNIAT